MVASPRTRSDSATDASHRDEQLALISAQVRRWILRATAEAHSGHPTSSLSAVELMTGLMFGGTFRYDLEHPELPTNDRLIFSKGHASPLFYALWAAAGGVQPDELMSYRQYGSRLEGHPTSRFPFTEAATGSLGQGLTVGVGMALAGKRAGHPAFRTYVLLGDSEMAEGSQWEAIQIAANYHLDNLIGIVDVNRLGQRGQTMYGHDLEAYRRRIEAFDWRCIVLDDGHDLSEVCNAYAQATTPGERPVMIVARTLKGKGVDFLEDEEGFHGKPVEAERMPEALDEVGRATSPSSTSAGQSRPLPAHMARPEQSRLPPQHAERAEPIDYDLEEQGATRDAYGSALCRLAMQYPHLVALDGEVCNSTRAQKFRDAFPDRFYEMFIAEQNMVGAAIGMGLRGSLPYVSTFAAFLTRAFDQIRMAPYSQANVKFVGSHCGVSVGKDGPSQMGLEDIAMFRTLRDSVVLYPCDAVSTEALVEAMAEHPGVCYLRTTRGKTPVIYDNHEKFPIGGSKTLRRTADDRVTLIAAGITLHQALEAANQLRELDIAARVIDLYSIQPIDQPTLQQAAEETGLLFTIEDHCPAGGLGEAVLSSLTQPVAEVHCLAVRQQPLSGSPEKQLQAQGLTAAEIVTTVSQVLCRRSRPRQ